MMDGTHGANSAAASSRYFEKINNIGGVDPYCIAVGEFKDLSCFNSDSLPALGYPDIFNYLINTPGYSGQSLKAYKSLEAYRYFVAGHVGSILLTPSSKRGIMIITAKVQHSQKSDAPLKPWLAVQMDGVIINTHCNCMAGLGESCSHVAAVMFAIEAAVKMAEGTACTTLPCKWSASTSRRADFSTASEIDFTSPKQKCTPPTPGSQSRKVFPPVPPVTSEDAATLYEDLAASGARCAILSLIPRHCQQFVPRSVLLDLPKPLSELYNSESLELQFPALLEKSEEVYQNIKVTPSQATIIEKETRGQSHSKLWFQQRAGRITASKFKSVAATDSANPSQSLIKSICYPEAFKFSTAATKWGCQHEATARTMYQELIKTQHQDFKVEDAGLFIHPDYPYLGASPDGMVTCGCCGKGVLEIKCPHSKRMDNLSAKVCDKGFCLEENNSGHLQLKTSHPYYFQVQAQIVLAEANFCDFVVWTQNGPPHIQRIMRDDTFEVNLPKITAFYKYGILPELMAKWYTRHPSVPSLSASVPSRDAWCYCRRPDDGNMIQCKSGICTVEKFHISCLRIKAVPKRKWECSDCRKIKKANKLSSQSSTI